jgi:hypothetical protein
MRGYFTNNGPGDSNLIRAGIIRKCGAKSTSRMDANPKSKHLLAKELIDPLLFIP